MPFEPSYVGIVDAGEDEQRMSLFLRPISENIHSPEFFDIAFSHLHVNSLLIEFFILHTKLMAIQFFSLLRWRPGGDSKQLENVYESSVALIQFYS